MSVVENPVLSVAERTLAFRNHLMQITSAEEKTVRGLLYDANMTMADLDEHAGPFAAMGRKPEDDRALNYGAAKFQTGLRLAHGLGRLVPELAHAGQSVGGVSPLSVDHRLRLFDDLVTATAVAATTQYGDDETHVDLKDMPVPTADDDPAMAYFFGQAYMANSVHLALRQFLPELEHLPVEEELYQGLITLLADHLTHEEPGYPLGKYSEVAENLLIPAVQDALAYLRLHRLKAIPWCPNDHWIDNIALEGKLKVDGKLRAVPVLVIGNLLDVSEAETPKDLTIREVADQIWFLYRVHQGVLPEPDWNSLLSYHSTFTIPAHERRDDVTE